MPDTLNLPCLRLRVCRVSCRVTLLSRCSAQCHTRSRQQTPHATRTKHASFEIYKLHTALCINYVYSSANINLKLDYNVFVHGTHHYMASANTT
jgi:hypothetical protein